MLIVSFFPLPGYSEEILVQWNEGYHVGQIEENFPVIDESLQTLLKEADAEPSDPIVFAGSAWGNLMPAWPQDDAEQRRITVTRAWLPTAPFALTAPLPDARKQIYLSRFIERARLGGWLVQKKEDGQFVNTWANALVSSPLLFDQLRRTHVPTRIYENADWQLVWYEYVGEQSEVVRPDYTWDRLGPLPPDVLVDGKPLSETTHPQVWTIFGEGWRLFNPAIEARTAKKQAELWVYSPDARDAQMRLTPKEVAADSTLEVTVEGGAKTRPVPLQARQPAEAPINLQPGWNLITVKVRKQRAQSEGAAGGGANEVQRQEGDIAGTDTQEMAGTRQELMLEHIEIVMRNP
jgi:hypothetical protein